MSTQDIPDNELDDFFKKSLQEPHVDFREEDWAKMEKKLEEAPGRKSAFRRYLYGLLALLLISSTGLFVWLNTDNAKTDTRAFQTNTQRPELPASVRTMEKITQNEKNTPAPAGNVLPNTQESKEIPAQPALIQKPATTIRDLKTTKGNLNKEAQKDKLSKVKAGEEIATINSETDTQARLSTKWAKKKEVPAVPNSDQTISNKPAVSRNSTGNMDPAGTPGSTRQSGKQIDKTTSRPSVTHTGENMERGQQPEKTTQYTPALENSNTTEIAGKALPEESVTTGVWMPDATMEDQPALLTYPPLAYLPVNIDLQEKYTEQLAVKAVDTAAIHTDPAKIAKKRVNYRFTLSLVLSPDISAVRLSQLTKPGSNLGLMLEYRFTNRISIATGIIRSTKVYDARIQDYSPPPGQWIYYKKPVEIKANCTVLDIPLNLRYTILARQRYNLFASTGLSSYLMLTEDYRYIYDVDDTYLRKSWHVDNQNKHYFKVYNLSAGYERRVGEHFSLQAEPFVKIPTAGVGFGKIKLWSTGVFLSARYRF